MKRSTFDRYCSVIQAKLHDINGRYYTPCCSYEYLDFISIHIVGSYARGVEEPEDLDLLILTRDGGKKTDWLDPRRIIHKEYYRLTGIKVTMPSVEAGFKWLTKGMKKVHRLDARIETTTFDCKIELYVNPIFLMATKV